MRMKCDGDKGGEAVILLQKMYRMLDRRSATSAGRYGPETKQPTAYTAWAVDGYRDVGEENGRKVRK